MTRALVPAILATALCVSAQEIRVTPSDVAERVRDAQQRREASRGDEPNRREQMQESLRRFQAERQGRGRCSVPLLTFRPGGTALPGSVFPVPKSYGENYPKAFYKEPPAPPCEERQDSAITVTRPGVENKSPKLP